MDIEAPGDAFRGDVLRHLRSADELRSGAVRGGQVLTRRAERRAAAMRLQNTENLRRARWRWIITQLQAGFLTPKEAEQQRREFWADRLRDKELSR